MSIDYLFITFGYITLLLELIFFHVPSVASNVNILRKQKSVVDTYSERFQKIFKGSFMRRFILTSVPLLLLYLVFVYPFAVIFDFIEGPTTTPSLVVWLACILIVFGRLITFCSVLIIRRQNKQKDDSFRLHTDFLFAHSRNPGLLGMYIFMLGVLLAMPSWLFLAGILYYFAYMHFKVLMEEDFLTQKFGEPYLDYKTTTGRYWS